MSRHSTGPRGGAGCQPETAEVYPSRGTIFPAVNRPKLKYLESNRVREWYLRNSFQKMHSARYFLLCEGFPEEHS